MGDSPDVSINLDTQIMAPKIFFVFGATGQQGGAVAKLLAEDPQLSKEYKVRAVVRDPAKPSAEALKNLPGCEIVQGDLDDKDSLQQALTGASAAFLVTASFFDEHLYERELAQGKAVADLAVEQGLEYLIFSTLPSVRKITSDKYTKVWHFDAKYDIEQYIRSLPIRSAFIGMGSFMQNLTNVLKPKPSGDGTFEIATSMPSPTRLPWIDATNVSTFVRAILREPEAFQGKTICAASYLCDLDEVAETISRVSGKTVKYKQLPAEVFRSFLPPIFAEDMMEMAAHYEEFGYFGPDMEELIRSSVNRDFGGLTTLEDFVHGIDFEEGSKTDAPDSRGRG